MRGRFLSYSPGRSSFILTIFFPSLLSDSTSVGSITVITPHEEELLILVEKIEKGVEHCCSWHRYSDITILCGQLSDKILKGDINDDDI